jgi:hypothetical protein
MAHFAVAQDYYQLKITTAQLAIGFSLDDGGLRSLQRLDGPPLIGFGQVRPTFDLKVGRDGAWIAERTMIRYLRHMIDERDQAVELTMVIGLGPLMIYDRYRIHGTSISRRLTINNVSEDEIQLHGVRLALPWVRLGERERCRFEAPGNSVRPRVPLRVAAQLRRDVLPRRFFAPGLRDNQAFEISPLIGPGLLALHEPTLGDTLLCWYTSDTETALPQAEGNDEAITLMHDIDLADRLRAGVGLSTGHQHLALLHEPWPNALATYRQTFHQSSTSSLLPSAAWLQHAILYEVHASEYGGFEGLENMIPSLAALGVNTICLMPIWAFANRSGQPWNGDWIDTGSPYAIADLTQLDATLGDFQALRSLISTIHIHQMHVVIDLPLEGCATSAALVREHPTWFCSNDNQELITLGAEPIHPYAWDNPELRDFVLQTALGWARDYGFDGYRVILHPRTPPNWVRRGDHQASASSLAVAQFISDLRLRLKQHHPEAVLLSNQGGPLATRFVDAACVEMPHHMFFHTALDRIAPAELSDWLTDFMACYPETTRQICFVENSQTRLINPLADGLRGSRISHMILAGMVFCGFLPLLHGAFESGSAAVIARILRARSLCETLRTGEVLLNNVSSSHPNVFVVARRSPNQLLLGILNIGSNKHTVTLKLSKNLLPDPNASYTMRDLLADDEQFDNPTCFQAATDLGELAIQLEPFGARCLQITAYPRT